MPKLFGKILTCNSSEEEKIKGVLAVEIPCEECFLKVIKDSARRGEQQIYGKM